ncbi:MAG: hypothetical protein PHH54_00775 [Candidatus Nanoarchaeia archaeon]|nr:hypothetical protein [Candidatus Nanoarchaeia archaeon]MDD5740496.1 hypothetical protein [Candidatus Nanoarchaeia archaeon]
MRKQALVFVFVLALLVIPLTSALSYLNSPVELFNSEWSKFTIIVVLLFVSIYSFLNRRMQNPAVSTIISLCVSILITLPIMQRGLIDPFLDPFFGPGGVDWIVIAAVLIAFFFLFYKFGMSTNEYGVKRFSLLRLIVFLFLLIILAYIAGDLLPETVIYGPVGDSIDWIKSLGGWTITIAIIIFIIIVWWGWKREKMGYGWRYRAQRRSFGGGGGGWFGRKNTNTGYDPGLN